VQVLVSWGDDRAWPRTMLRNVESEGEMWMGGKVG